MRIIFVLRSVVLSGGIERIMTEKASWLGSQGHNVLFLTYEQGSHSLSFPLDSYVVHKDLDCRYYTIYKKNILIRPLYMLLFKHKFKCRLKSTILSFCPDLMVIPSNLEEFLSPATSMSKYVPVAFECHSTHIEILGELQNLRGLVRKYMLLSCIKRCSVVFTLTEGDANYWKSLCKHVVAIPNPLPYYPEKIDVGEKVQGKIICVARLQRVKRIDRLIEAFSLISEKYPIWHIDIYGDGKEKNMILNMIAEKKLQNRVSVYAPTADIYKKYMESEFLVLSSDSEGFSLVLIEAMSCGIPVVSVDCPYGPASIVDKGVNGLLAEMSVIDLSAKMEWMITHDTERKMFGNNARKSASQYQKDVVLRRWEQTYSSVVNDI